jgi:hypothetical protein
MPKGGKEQSNIYILGYVSRVISRQELNDFGIVEEFTNVGTASMSVVRRERNELSEGIPRFGLG